MKRNKKLLISIVSVICSFVLVFASACAPETVTKTPESITINTTAVKTTYVVGETFTSAGLTATVNYNFSDGSKSSEATTDFEVNSTQFVSGTAGAYTISVTYTEGEATVSTSYSVTVLSSATLEIDSSSVKTVYEVGETLDLSGLTANYVETKADNSKTTTSVTSTMVVDSSSVNMSNMGTYTVTVRYTKPVDNISVSATFAVEVKGKIGLDVALAADVSDTIILSATAPTASFDASQIVVRQPDQTGSLVNSTPMASSDYTVEMYKAQEKLTPDAEGGTVYSNLSGGAYQVVANATISNEAVWGFALIYVVDNVSALTWDSTAEGTVATQETSAIDSITETLKFTVTYTSGATKQVTADDVQFTTPVSTTTVGENLTATATYSEVNTKGESITTTPATVTYTITEQPVDPDNPNTDPVSFLMENIETMNPVDAGGTVTTNALFTMETETEMDLASSLQSNPPTITPNSGISYTAGKGLRQSGDVPAGTDTPAISFTANSAISLKVYVTLANNSYNSHRPGTLHYSIDNGAVTDLSTGNRNVIVVISVNLQAGQVLKINYTNNHASNPAKLWFFGAEATAN